MINIEFHEYRKILIISPGPWLIFVQFDGLIFRGAYFQEGLLLEGKLHLRFGGPIFGRAYLWGGGGYYWNGM